MGMEKEVRYKVNDENITKIKQISNVIEKEKKQIDLTLGYKGFDSLKEYGYVCRVRQNKNRTWMEVKNRQNKNAFFETEVQLKNFKEGVEFFKALGMKPYLYMNRTREILEYKGLKIFIDNIELLGKFVEIEYQDLESPEEACKEFLNITEINPEEQPLYGDIFKELIEKNESFKSKFEQILKKFLNE